MPGAFAGRHAADLAKGDYVLLSQEHVMIGRGLSDGRRIVYDVQNQAILPWEIAIQRYGWLDAFRVIP